MEIHLHDGRVLRGATEEMVEREIVALSDAGDFIRLVGVCGEIRAAGPARGKFLVQCELHSEGKALRGEKDDMLGTEVITRLREFMNGDLDWFREVSIETSRTSTRKLLWAVAVLLAIGLLLWRYAG